jgi:hypothetical protein
VHASRAARGARRLSRGERVPRACGGVRARYCRVRTMVCWFAGSARTSVAACPQPPT